MNLEWPTQKTETPKAVENTELIQDGQEDENNLELENDLKTIEIPGLGEIKYYEKVVKFPESRVRETGGVNGYVRKTIPWSELKRFEENTKDSNWQALLKLLPGMTKGEFINDTYNHVFNGRWENIKNTFKEDQMIFQDVGSLDIIANGIGYFNFSIASKESSCIIDVDDFIKKLDLPADLAEKLVARAAQVGTDRYSAGNSNTSAGNKIGSYLFKGLPDNESNVLLEALKKQDDYYFIAPFGLSLEDRNKKIWNGLMVSNLHETSTFGFGRRNKAMRKYNQNASKVLEKFYWTNAENKRNEVYYDDFTTSLGTTKLLMSKDWTHEEQDESDPYGGWFFSEDMFKDRHPHIPLILNHENVPQLKWCHADFAAIPTKNGYNILEMITDMEEK